jgi:hypothetical protein
VFCRSFSVCNFEKKNFARLSTTDLFFLSGFASHIFAWAVDKIVSSEEKTVRIHLPCNSLAPPPTSYSVF